MELDTLDPRGGVPQAHRELAVPRGDDQFGRQRLLGDNQRVVARRAKSLRQAGQHAEAVVADLADLPVHRARGPDHARAERRGDRLVAKADAEQRDPSGAAADHVDADARLGRGARSRGDHHARRP